MAQVQAFIDNSAVPRKCESKWGGNDCPNRPEFLLVTISRVGFGIMCGPHKEGFDSVQHGHDYRVEPYSPERAKELQAEVAVAYGEGRL